MNWSLRRGHETQDGVTPLTVHFLADGPRDHEALRRLTERFLGRTIDHFQNECWRDIKLTRGRGFDRKLEYVVGRLQRKGNRDGSGVVAMVDQDKAGPRERLEKLFAGRAATRQNPKAAVVATAVGEARPNFDALLVDCRRAVAEAVECCEDEVPKEASRAKGWFTERAMAQGIEPSSLLAAVAERFALEFCADGRGTGAEEFAEDLRQEWAPR